MIDFELIFDTIMIAEKEKINIYTHSFLKDDSSYDTIFGSNFVCSKCNLNIYRILGRTIGDYVLTCDEAIIKNILE